MENKDLLRLYPLLDRYTDKEIKNWRLSSRVVVAHSSADIQRFIERSLSNGSYDGKLMIGKIGEYLAVRIERDTGVDLYGYNLELRAHEIRHAIKHSNEATEQARGQRAITADDFFSFANIVTNYEKVSVAEDNSLHFQKNVNGKVTAVTLYAHGNKSLSLKTMYAAKNRADG